MAEWYSGVIGAHPYASLAILIFFVWTIKHVGEYVRKLLEAG